MIQTLIRINIYISLVKRYLRQYCDNGEIVTAAARSDFHSNAAIAHWITYSLIHANRTQEQLAIASSAIYIRQ